MKTIVNIPSPKDLAQKEATRTLSIRVKEKTMLAFERYAQQYNVTASSLINNVLDAYIANQDSDIENDKAISRKVMTQYLEKLAGRIGKCNDKDLCITLANNTDYSNIDEISATEYAQQVESVKEGGNWDATLSVFMGDSLSTEFECWDEDKSYRFDDDPDLNIIAIPAQKYAIVANMILGYVVKNEHLYNGSRKQMIDLETINELINIINTTDDRTELAKKIGKTLANYESPQEIE